MDVRIGWPSQIKNDRCGDEIEHHHLSSYISLIYKSTASEKKYLHCGKMLYSCFGPE